ncbi:DUF7714 family protein [Nocardioides aquiterrae]|uniref:Uncharacterized protein n=1 Tax=Nocardioides aquiterrae TaxID=203799 RepID=A0ABP4ERD9_9ACTN
MLGEPNVVPSRYRQVAVAAVPSLEPAWLAAHFTGREVYFRTRFVVARHGQQVALVEVEREQSDELFAHTISARVVAGPDACAVVVDEALDTAVPSQLATAAERVPGARCVVVEGRYSHVSFILNPAPVRIRLVDVVPPEPAKLLDQVQRVLSTADDLPPVVVAPDLVDSRELLATRYADPPRHLLIPCRGSGMDFPGSTVSFLDERPPERAWTLLGCERSNQIHQWFYGSAPDRVDTCPRQWIAAGQPATLTRCCLLQEGVEDTDAATVVPWGASLAEVRTAIEAVVDRVGVAWTHI